MRQWSISDFALLILLALGVSFAVVMLLAILTGCSSTPSPKVTDCGAQYGACVASSPDVASYRACRAKVDAVCLAFDGGAP
jgi:hypothetical protein